MPVTSSREEYVQKAIELALANPDPYYPDALTKEQLEVVQLLLYSFPSAVLTRKSLRDFSGGALDPGTTANKNHTQSGVRPIKETRGRQVTYRAIDVALYLVGAVPENW